MMLRIKVGSNTLGAQLKGMLRAFGDAGRKRVLTDVAKSFKDMAQSTFGANKNAYRGNKWQRYSPAYTKRVGSSTPTLYRTGKLKNSIRVMGAQGNRIAIISNTKYSAVQFLGGGNNIPSRKYFPLEGQGSVWRLTQRADKELTLLVAKGFSVQSNGALPRLTGIGQRSAPAYGNPTTG